MPAPTEPKAPNRDWKRVHLWQIQPVRDALAVLLVLGLVWIGYLLRVVTVPILLALLLAYLFEPLVRRLTRRGLLSRRGVALGVIVLAGVAVVVPALLGLGLAVVQGVRVAQQTAVSADVLIKSVDAPGDADLRASLPNRTWIVMRDYVVEQEARTRASEEESRRRAEAAVAGLPPPESPPIQARVPALGAAPGTAILPPSPEYQLVRQALDWLRANPARVGQRALATGADAISAALNALGSLGMLLFGACLTAFFFFFFSTGYGRILAFWDSLIPEARRGRVVELLGKMDRVIAGFVRGRLTIAAIIMVLYTIGYWALGTPAPLLLGPIVGVLSILPFASSLGIPAAMLLMWLDPSLGLRGEWWWIVFAPVVLSMLAQAADDYVLTPAIQGKSTDLGTPSILFASIAGGVLAGVYGLLLAIPVAACIRILLREIVAPQIRNWVKGRAADFLPIER